MGKNRWVVEVMLWWNCILSCWNKSYRNALFICCCNLFGQLVKDTNTPHSKIVEKGPGYDHNMALLKARMLTTMANDNINHRNNIFTLVASQTLQSGRKKSYIHNLQKSFIHRSIRSFVLPSVHSLIHSFYLFFSGRFLWISIKTGHIHHIALERDTF